MQEWFHLSLSLTLVACGCVIASSFCETLAHSTSNFTGFHLDLFESLVLCAMVGGGGSGDQDLFRKFLFWEGSVGVLPREAIGNQFT